MNKRGRMKRNRKQLYDKHELWNLDEYLALHISEAIKEFKNVNVNSYPGKLENIEEWHNILDEIIYSFREIANDYPHNPREIDFNQYLKCGNNWQDYKEVKAVKEDKEMYFTKIKDGKQKFIDFFGCLWD